MCSRPVRPVDGVRVRHVPRDNGHRRRDNPGGTAGRVQVAAVTPGGPRSAPQPAAPPADATTSHRVTRGSSRHASRLATTSSASDSAPAATQAQGRPGVGRRALQGRQRAEPQGEVTGSERAAEHLGRHVIGRRAHPRAGRDRWPGQGGHAERHPPGRDHRGTAPHQRSAGSRCHLRSPSKTRARPRCGPLQDAGPSKMRAPPRCGPLQDAGPAKTRVYLSVLVPGIIHGHALVAAIGLGRVAHRPRYTGPGAHAPPPRGGRVARRGLWHIGPGGHARPRHVVSGGEPVPAVAATHGLDRLEQIRPLTRWPTLTQEDPRGIALPSLVTISLALRTAGGPVSVTALDGLRHPRDLGRRMLSGRRVPSSSRSSSTGGRPTRSIFLRTWPSSAAIKTPPRPVKPVWS